VLDAAGNAYAGIANNTTLNFKATEVAVPGQTFMLTVNTDNIAGTSGNDTINAAYVTGSNGGSSFNSLDVISGGAGTDTLNIEYGQTINGTITSVEKVFYKGKMTADGGTGAALQTVDASKVGGLEQLWFDNVTEAAPARVAIWLLLALLPARLLASRAK